MLNKILLIIFFLSLSSILYSQDLDTIKLNNNLSATLEFESEISFIVLGNNPLLSQNEGNPNYKYYDIFQQENIVIFRVKSLEAPFTTLNIKLANGSLYHGFISQSKSPEKTYYNFRKTNDTNLIQQGKKDSSEIASKDINNKLSKLQLMTSDLDHIAEIKKNIIFKVSNIVNDDKYYYIKVLLNNNSSNLYEVDGVTFKMQEGKKKSIKNKEIANQNWLSPIKTIYPENKQIKAYSQGFICFVVPLYNITSGSLLIKIVESNGARNGNIDVSANDLTNTKVFHK